MTQTIPAVVDPTVCDPYHPDTNSQTFNLHTWLSQYDPRLFADPKLRRTITKYNPLLFAIVYLAHHLKTDGQISFADPHFRWARQARSWAVNTPELLADRHVFVAPRDTGKSSWWFLILPTWAAAHGHKRFIAAFAHSGTQAESHLYTFRSELSENQLLRQDYPGLCYPARRSNGQITDNLQMWRSRDGFAFTARGIDAANLGLKEKDRRPDLLLCDDMEPDEASYSIYRMGKRRGTLIEAILPMNLRATVILVGTVTMPGSIVHQCVEHAAGVSVEENKETEWVVQERFQVHHQHPIPTNPDGSERSIWPAKWPLQFLQSIRHTRTYAKNFANSPLGIDGGYWSMDDFTHERWDGATRQILSIDPTITTTTRSDPAGLAVVSYYPQRLAEPAAGRRNPTVIPARCSVDYCRSVRAVGETLRAAVLRLLTAYPRIRLVLVEGNQGGDNWHAVLHDLPLGVKLRVVWSTEPKEVRAADLLELYQHQPTRVGHSQKLPSLEQQMCIFPRGHDDEVDAVGAVVRRLLAPPLKRKAQTVYQR